MRKILDPPYDRSILGEGRDYGIGFTILDKVGRNYKPLFPFTACKDYLNDVIHIERNNVALDEIYGFKHEYMGLFDKNALYLGVNCLHRNSNKGNWDKYDDAQEILIDTSFLLESALNQIETIFGIKKLTTVDVVENSLVLNISKLWATNSMRMSYLTLFIRCMFNFEGAMDAESMKTHAPLIDEDKLMFENITKGYTLGKIFFKEVGKYRHPKSICDDVHNNGIVYWLNDNYDRVLTLKTKKDEAYYSYKIRGGRYSGILKTIQEYNDAQVFGQLSVADIEEVTAEAMAIADSIEVPTIPHMSEEAHAQFHQAVQEAAELADGDPVDFVWDVETPTNSWVVNTTHPEAQTPGIAPGENNFEI